MSRWTLALCAALLPALSLAQVPQKLGYQGRLLKADGTPESGSTTLVFKLFDGSTEVWSETQTVALTDGYYAIELGDVAALPANIFNGHELALELTANGAALSPRQRVTSVPYAMACTNLTGGTVNASSVTVGGSSGVSLSSSGITVNGTAIVDGSGAFQISQASAGSSGLLSSSDWSAFNNKAPASGSGSYIQNQSAGPQANASFAISGTGAANSGLVASSRPATAGTSGTVALAANGASLGTCSGTASIAAGSTALSGDSVAKFASELATGDVIVLTASGSSQMFQVASVSANNAAVVTPPATANLLNGALTIQKPVAALLGTNGKGVVINGQGQVGIGTANPAASLHVGGNVQSDGAYAGFGIMPIGSIIAWHKGLPNTPALPAGWAECNGQTISDAASPYNGVALPNLNGSGLFLRGSATSGTLQNASRVAVTLETNSSYLYFDASGRNMTQYNGDFDATDTLAASQRGYIAKTGTDSAPGQIYAARVRPANMSVVWIMRIK